MSVEDSVPDDSRLITKKAVGKTLLAHGSGDGLAT
jgi:hypothetical protein